MNYSIRPGLVFLFVVFSLTRGLAPVTANDDGEAPQDVLGRLVGTWKVDIVSRPSVEDEKEIRRVGTGRTEWFLDEQFVRNAAYDENADPADFEGRVFNIWGYDAKRGKYRAWYFDSDGNAGDSDGQYDHKSKTLTFTTTSGEGNRIVTTIRFINENRQDWSTTVKDENGKLVRTITMNLQRK